MGKQNKQKQTIIPDIPQDNKDFYKPSSFERVLLFGLPIFGAIIILFIWFEIYKPKVIDEWYKGVMLVDSSNKVTDPMLKKSLMESGGLILRQQVKLHPYHARVWFLYGYYFLRNDNWDSCIYAEKKAIELGAGGVVNNVEFIAADQLNYALDRKLSKIRNLDSAIKVLNDASTPNFENNYIYKIKGITYYNYNQIDSCNFYMERFYARAKNDFDVLYVLALVNSRKGIKDKAFFFATEAKKIRNDSPDIDRLIGQINAQ